MFLKGFLEATLLERTPMLPFCTEKETKNFCEGLWDRSAVLSKVRPTPAEQEELSRQFNSAYFFKR